MYCGPGHCPFNYRADDGKQVQLSFVMAHNASMSDFHKFETDLSADWEMKQLASRFFRSIAGLLRAGRFKAHPVTL